MNDIEVKDCVGVLYRNAVGRTIVRNGAVTRITSTTIRIKRLNLNGNIVFTNIPRSRIIKIVGLED